MTYSEGRELAEMVIARLAPVVEKVKICGSIRRKSHEVSDVDIVVLPHRDDVKDMFGTKLESIVCPEFVTIVNQWEKIVGDPSGKYTQRIVKGHKVELSIAQEHNFGNLVLIRTGDHNFSHMIMKRVIKLGLAQRDGGLYDGNKLIPVPEEEEYFRILNLPFIKPENRNADAFKGLSSR